MFNSANFIVAVHGGGLSNLVYCEAGTDVLEIFPDQYVPHAYGDIADKRNLRYHFMLLPSTGTATDAIFGQRLGVFADVEKIESKVKTILQDQKVPLL